MRKIEISYSPGLRPALTTIMYPNPWDPIGEALLAYYNGDTSAKITILSDFEPPGKAPVSHFFREPDDFSPLELTALSLCKSRVLDIGAGAGCHTLALQELGHSVCAIDVAPQAVEVMSLRGVKETCWTNIFNFRCAGDVNVSGGFDTLLLMMNGIGIVENLDGLRRFLEHAKTLLNPAGNLVFDSLDLRETCSPAEIIAREAHPARSYFGEVSYSVSFRGKSAPDFWWLYIDNDRLIDIASVSGWTCDGIYPGEDGHYLARLSL